MSETDETAFRKPLPKKRGRPRTQPLGASLKAIQGLWPSAGTRRHQQNIYYSQVTFEALGGKEEREQFAWLWEGRRQGIREELGRSGDRETIRRFAAQLCEDKPKVKEAILLLRRWRMDCAKVGDAEQLADEIARAMDHYLLRYPETSQRQLLEALEIIRESVERLHEPEDE